MKGNIHHNSKNREEFKVYIIIISIYKMTVLQNYTQ